MDIEFIKTPKPIGNFVNVRYTGNLAYISGQGPFDDNGELITGKVGEELNLEKAYDAARRVGLKIFICNQKLSTDAQIYLLNILAKKKEFMQEAL